MMHPYPKYPTTPRLRGRPPRVGIDELVRRVVAHDLELARQERMLREAGHVVAARRGRKRQRVIA